MFTGIVEELGEVVSVKRRGPQFTQTHRGRRLHHRTCLTVTACPAARLTADVMATLRPRPGLGDLTAQLPVNLEERSLRQRVLGGHMVQGHRWTAWARSPPPVSAER